MNLEKKQADMRRRLSAPEPEAIRPAMHGPKNNPLTLGENRVFDLLKSEGYVDIIRNGWPDFAIEAKGKLLGIEVKTGADELSDAQKKTHRILKRLGIPVIVVKSEWPLSSILQEIRKVSG